MTTLAPGNTAAFICVIIAAGMSTAFWVADRRVVTTRLLSAFLLCIAVSIYLNIVWVRPYPPHGLPWPSLLAPVATGLALLLGAEWVLRIRRMVPAGNLRTRVGDTQFRLAQGLACIYMLLGTSLNSLRVEYFVNALRRDAAWANPEFWYFAVPFILVIVCLIDGTLMTLRRKPDRAESRRLVGIAVASPLLASALLLPAPWAAYVSSIGQMVFLVAAVQYHVMQGQRGQFLRRFLSPAVADLVRRQGMRVTMQHQKLPVTAVACDLRGYTQYARGRDSAEVIDLLQQFYDEVGQAAAEHNATIKDYAGDGVLLLLGAPLAMDNHSAVAVALAASVRERCQQSFAEAGIDLGVGIGIASGIVSVGVIGKERLEYAAVGEAINLAARLCQSASAGAILTDEDTLAQLPERTGFVAAEPLALKGFDEAIETWEMAAS